MQLITTPTMPTFARNTHRVRFSGDDEDDFDVMEALKEIPLAKPHIKMYANLGRIGDHFLDLMLYGGYSNEEIYDYYKDKLQLIPHTSPKTPALWAASVAVDTYYHFKNGGDNGDSSSPKSPSPTQPGIGITPQGKKVKFTYTVA